MTALPKVHLASTLVPFCLALTALLPVSLPAAAQSARPFVEVALSDIEAAVGSPVRSAISPRTGLATFVSFAHHQQTLGKLAGTEPAEARARAFLDDYGSAFGVFNRESVSLTRAEETDELGMEHVRFKQLRNGVPITGGELTVHLHGSAVVAVNAKTVANLEQVNTTPVVSAAEAAALAATALAEELGITDAKLSPPRLELLNKGHLGGRGFATSLTWFIEATRIDLREYLWIDAFGGKLVLQFSQLTDAKNRMVHDTASSSALPGPLARGEGAGPTGDTDVDAAYDYSGDTYDYFFNVHGRDSYDGAGATLISTVDYCPSGGPCPFANAFWNGTQMVYGAGFPAADDVDAHELTHAVTERTANLFYYMQSGALNESFSDIFGETVDLTNAGGTDTPAVRWQMGEDVPGFGAIRNMMDPTLFGDPGKVSDIQFVCTGGTGSGEDAGGVHQNSGVPNHAYALMVDGGIYNGKTVSPALGLTKAGKIQYRALATYLSSASDFLDNYNALWQSCEDLIGTAGITATDCAEMKDALDAVEMASPWNCSPAQAVVPSLCPAGQAPTMAYFTDIESVSFTHCPTDTTPTLWCKNGPTSLLGAFATSGTESFWGYNRPTAGFMTVSDVTQVLLPAGAKMQFNHSFGFENGSDNWDGGQIRTSTDNGATWPDGGGLISEGQAYGGLVSSSFGNPLGGQSAFVKDTWGYTATQLDLSSLAGQNFRYQFFVGTDSSVDDYGWFVDDIRIYTCAACLTDRVLTNAHSGTAPLFKATNSITAGSGFTVGLAEIVTLQATTVNLDNGFSAIGGLEIANTPCILP